MAPPPTIRIVAIEPAGAAATDHVALDHDRRTRRRMTFTTDGGAAILLDLPRPAHLRDGDVLRLADGTGVRVVAAAEAVTDIAAPSLAALVRIAWHLGNRHLSTQLIGDRLRIRRDHVIAAMAEGLGGTCTDLAAPFDPEGGAYAGDGASGAGGMGAGGGHHHHHGERDIAQHDHGHHHHG